MCHGAATYQEVIMSLFKVKDGEKNSNASLEEKMKQVADKHGVTLAELKRLAEGKSCPVYGTKELLHVRCVRGGKLVVFNISEKHRGEKISKGRKNISESKGESLEK